MQHILTGCYIAKPKGHSHISKHCGARMRHENGVWQDVETFARNTHALILKKGVKRKKINEKTFKTKVAAEKYFNKLLES
nr:MAG TPA: hypothetical protein [Caudoviricetes sp.]